MVAPLIVIIIIIIIIINNNNNIIIIIINFTLLLTSSRFSSPFSHGQVALSGLFNEGGEHRDFFAALEVALGAGNVEGITKMVEKGKELKINPYAPTLKRANQVQGTNNLYLPARTKF